MDSWLRGTGRLRGKQADAQEHGNFEAEAVISVFAGFGFLPDLSPRRSAVKDPCTNWNIVLRGQLLLLVLDLLPGMAR